MHASIQRDSCTDWFVDPKNSMDRYSSLLREKQTATDNYLSNAMASSNAVTSDQGSVFPCRYPQYYNNMDTTNANYNDTLPSWNSYDFNQSRQCLNTFQSPPIFNGGGAISQHTYGINPTNYGAHPASNYTGNVPGVTDVSNCSWLTTFTTTPRRTKRKPYTKMQIFELEQAFQNNMYLTRERRTKLSQQLSLSERQIKIWFQNRRMKLKKMTEREKLEEKELREHQAL
ncbi:homeobox 11/13b [Saccoglossus kowalevskii]|uniref:Homeobox 11/13b n=1 Tax=Saccoglossus kowalevskii TaxID=10224 RepID=A0FDP8_SACKO|nr:homeobox 11/13b [Saccoglossus kowalevskii]ABK00023.1 hox 11/13b [Saccoglossus kowalevskii]